MGLLAKNVTEPRQHPRKHSDGKGPGAEWLMASATKVCSHKPFNRHGEVPGTALLVAGRGALFTRFDPGIKRGFHFFTGRSFGKRGGTGGGGGQGRDEPRRVYQALTGGSAESLRQNTAP